MPNTWNLRFLFLLYVCYCFVMSTVFQAFFVSYLVEPGYGKRIETFEELVHSSLDYGYNEVLELGLTTTNYKEHRRFSRERRVNCTDMKKCLERIVINSDLCTVSTPEFTQFLTSEIGVEDVNKYLCSLEENLATVGAVYVLRNGSPFLNRINTLMRRVLEGGLLERYWNELKWITNLRSKKTAGNDNLYTEFSLSHLRPAFSVLLFGYVLSALGLLVEVITSFCTKCACVNCVMDS
jgi:hypothetical protein